MKPAKKISASGLVERINELTKLEDKVSSVSNGLEVLRTRIKELQTEKDKRLKTSTFNRGVINPVPPDRIDIFNEAVITPKPPSEVEREYNDWEKTLEKTEE